MFGFVEISRFIVVESYGKIIKRYLVRIDRYDYVEHSFNERTVNCTLK